jgi:hypothetical protein
MPFDQTQQSEHILELQALVKAHDEELFVEVLNTQTNFSQAGWEQVRNYTAFVDQTILKATKTFQEIVEEQQLGQLITIGGTGRVEQSLSSDVDLLYIANKPIDELVKEELTKLSLELQAIFPKRLTSLIGVADLDDLSALDGITWNALCDYRFLQAQTKTQSPLNEKIREQISQSYNANTRLLSILDEKSQPNPKSTQSLEFNLKEDEGGLRNAQLAIWLQTVQSPIPMQQALNTCPKYIYDAIGTLLFTRNAIKAIEPKILFEESTTLTKSRFAELHQRFGSDLISQIQHARQTIKLYAKATTAKETSHGVTIAPNIILKPPYQGIEIDSDNHVTAANILTVLTHAQKHGLPVGYSFATSPKLHALHCGSEYLSLLTTPGKLAPTLEHLLDFGLLSSIIPGFEKLQNRPNLQFTQTIAGVVLDKFKALDDIYQEDVKVPPNLGKNFTQEQKFQLAYLLLIEELPLEQRANLYNSHNISQQDQAAIGELETKSRNLRRTIRSNPINTDVEESTKILKSENTPLNLIFAHMYTHSFFAQPELTQKLWELYDKINGETSTTSIRDVLEFGEEGIKIFKAIPPQFMTSRYKDDKNAIADLVKAYTTKKPQVTMSARNGVDTTYRIACEDYPGLLANITGALYAEEQEIRGVHTFTLFNEDEPLGLALDYITVRGKHPKDVKHKIAAAIEQKKSPEINTNTILGQMHTYELEYLRPFLGRSQYTLIAKSDTPVSGSICALTRELATHAQANIFNLTVHNPTSTTGERYTVHFETNLQRENIERVVSNFPRISY